MPICTECGDEYAEVEYAPVPRDPDEPRFCSSECEIKYWETEEASREYDAAGWPATVF